MEQTQASASAPAQVQQPVHPIHQETATINALTEWVKSTPDNDPHEGTDLEEPKKETQEPKEEEKGEEKPTEQIELPEDEPLFEIEYKTENGKEQKKLSLKELREGYLAKQDYHRNIQKVKAQEAELATKVQQAQTQAAQQFIQQVELQKQAITKLAGVKTMPEIEALAKEDPAAAQQEFLKFINVNQTYQALDAQQRQAAQQLQQQQQAARAQAVEKARTTLASDVPGWGPDLYGKVLGSMVSDYGLAKEGVEQVAEAELIKVFHDAYQYRSLQKAKPEVSKRVVAVPKVIKPGSAEKPSPAKEQAERSYERLKKTGRMEDAVQAYLARQQKK